MVACGAEQKAVHEDSVEQTIGVLTGNSHSEVKAQDLVLASAEPVASSFGSMSAPQ
jgi:hypothetical protein